MLITLNLIFIEIVIIALAVFGVKTYIKTCRWNNIYEKYEEINDVLKKCRIYGYHKDEEFIPIVDTDTLILTLEYLQGEVKVGNPIVIDKLGVDSTYIMSIKL